MIPVNNQILKLLLYFYLYVCILPRCNMVSAFSPIKTFYLSRLPRWVKNKCWMIPVNNQLLKLFFDLYFDVCICSGVNSISVLTNQIILPVATSSVSSKQMLTDLRAFKTAFINHPRKLLTIEFLFWRMHFAVYHWWGNVFVPKEIRVMKCKKFDFSAISYRHFGQENRHFGKTTDIMVIFCKFRWFFRKLQDMAEMSNFFCYLAEISKNLTKKTNFLIGYLLFGLMSFFSFSTGY